MLKSLYNLARTALFALNPEDAHEATLKALECGLHPRPFAADDPILRQTVFGLDFPNPVGIAAGFDKDARVADAVLAMGCGFAEAGTLTPKPQPGNPKPRIFRLVTDHGLINRLGFNNGGHAAALARLDARKGRGGIVGVNIGANKDSADRAGDYVAGIEAFNAVASYFTVNISSPNTPGLRDLQAPAALDELLSRVMAARARLIEAGAPRRPIIVKIAPLAAFGAMGFTIGKYGISSLVQLSALVGVFYLTSAVFIFGVLGSVAWLSGFSIIRFLAYIREELLIVLGTSSSETVLPQIMEKMERLGAAKSVVGLVIPAGYSFNLDGTNIYMTLATLFLAQATNTHLGVEQIATLLIVAMLTSKGATGVTGAGFIVLAATLAVVPDIPVAALAILVGVDRFMSQCRALVNLIGNGVAALVVAASEKQLDRARLNMELKRGPLFVERLEASNKPIVEQSTAS